jgi:hypothetical protein
MPSTSLASTASDPHKRSTTSDDPHQESQQRPCARQEGSGGQSARQPCSSQGGGEHPSAKSSLQIARRPLRVDVHRPAGSPAAASPGPTRLSGDLEHERVSVLEKLRDGVECSQLGPFRRRNPADLTPAGWLAHPATLQAANGNDRRRPQHHGASALR